MRPSLSLAIDFLRAHQNPDGGWGYEPGRMSLVEPSAVSLLAIHSSGDMTGSSRGLDFLRSCQKSSGAVGLGPKDADGSWMAYAALLAFHALGAADEERRLKDWVLGFTDASGHFTPDDIKAISAVYRYDASIRGWPWTSNTTGWVEPTALFVIALVRVGTPPTQNRVRSGVSLILDRKVPSGGWNFGNPFSKSHELEATVMSTALALTALGAAGVPESRPAIGEGIRYLNRSLAGEVSTASLAWALLALRSYPAGASQVPGVAARLAGLQAGDGSFRRNLFETALAALVLGDAGALLRPPRRSG